MTVDGQVRGRRRQRPAIYLTTGTLQRGGAERVLADMANYWAEKGFDVTLATWSGPAVADAYWLHDTVTRAWLGDDQAGGSRWRRLRALFRGVMNLRRRIRDHRPDLVVSFIDISNVLTLLATLRTSTNVAVSVRTNPALSNTVSPLWRLLRRALIGRAKVVVAQTAGAAEWIRDNWNVTVEVIPNPLRPLPEIVGQRELTVLGVGRLEAVKGFDLLTQAFAKIRAQHPNWKLIIIGDGKQKQRLLALRDACGLTEQMVIAEPVAEVEMHMASASIVVQPSRFEGFPNVVLEAMGMGAAVISSDCDWGPREIIRDGVDGRLVPVGDVDALASAMDQLMDDRDLRMSLGQSAQAVRHRFSQQDVMSKWESLIAANAAVRGSNLAGTASGSFD